MLSQITGAAEHIEITPARALPLAGFATRTRRSRQVAHTLEANALALTDIAGRTAIIVTFDALFVGPVVEERLRAFLEAQEIHPADILLLASHTHFAPGLDPTKPALGTVEPAYVDEVITRCEVMLTRLLAKPRSPLVLRHGRSDWAGSINRRRPWPLPYRGLDGKIGWQPPAMAPNSRGPREKQIRYWSLRDNDGTDVATLWSCACHPTGFPDHECLTSEYPGRVREFVRNGLGTELPILFLQGFAGDVRQRAPETRPFPRRMARTLLDGPSFCAFDRPGWERWVKQLCASLGEAMQRAARSDGEPLTGSVRSSATSAPLKELLEGGGNSAVWMRRVRIGRQLDFWAVAAEPSAALADFLPKGKETIALGYLGDVFGYWPTARQAAEGGYEGGGFLKAFGLTGRLRESIDQTFQGMVERLKAPDDEF